MALKELKGADPQKEDELLYAGAIEEMASPEVIEIPEIAIIERVRTVSEAQRMLGHERIRKVFRRLYVDEGLSIPEIAKMLGKSTTAIRRRLHTYAEEGLLEVRPRITTRYLSALVPYKEQEMRRIEYVERRYVTMHYIYPFPEMAYIIGFIIGDGTVYHKTVSLYNTEFGFFEEILNRARKVANRFNEGVGITYYDKKMKTVDRLEAYLWRITISSSALARAFVTPEGTIREDALDTLFKPHIKPHFLAGLWDADGTIKFRAVNRRIDIELYQSQHNLPLLRRIASELTKQAIPISLPYLVTKAGKTHYLNKHAITRREDYYSIRVRKNGLLSWLTTIGGKMLHPKKLKTMHALGGLEGFLS